MKSCIYALFTLLFIVNPSVYSMDNQQKALDKEFVSKAMLIITAFEHSRIYSAIDSDLTITKYQGYVVDTIENNTLQLHSTNEYDYVICKGNTEEFPYLDTYGFKIEGLYQPYFSVFKKGKSKAEALCYVTFETKEKSLEAALFATSLQTLRNSEQVKIHTEFFKLFEDTLKKDGIKKISVFIANFLTSGFYPKQGYSTYEGFCCFYKNLEDKKE